MGTKKFYVIWIGNRPGIVNSWEECQLRTKGYPGARYKSFKSLPEAQKAFNLSWSDYITPKGNSTPKIKENSDPSHVPTPNSLSVDAACSGNPGRMEYQGVHVGTRKQWFHAAFPIGTNNIGEFLGIVHGLAELKRRNLNIPIYTDSRIAMGWIKKKKCVTKLERTPDTEKLFKLIDRAENWLLTNTYSQPILKWDTKVWGEIPADFGRK